MPYLHLQAGPSHSLTDPPGAVTVGSETSPHPTAMKDGDTFALTRTPPTPMVIEENVYGMRKKKARDRARTDRPTTTTLL